MNLDSDFYKWFNNIAPKLNDREISFRKIFKYLDSLPDPIIIVETGCLRDKDNFTDGQSTLLFDKYTLARGKGSKVYSVDIDINATNVCKKIVSKQVDLTTDDSIKYLNNFSNNFLKTNKKLSLLYLDSFNVDWKYPYPSAAHHLKEITASIKILNKKTLIVIDDSPSNANIAEVSKDNWKLLSRPTVSGKGYSVDEFATQINAKKLFSFYQTGWINFCK